MVQRRSQQNLTENDGTEGEDMKGNYTIISNINLEKTSARLAE